MDCASCAAVIENTLKKEKGIKSVNVNFAVEKAYLEFSPDETSIAVIKKNIESLGYKAEEEGSESESPEIMVQHTDHHEFEKIEMLKKRFILAFVFGSPIIYMVMGGLIGLPMPEIFENYGIQIQFILATAVILSCFNIWVMGFKSLLRFAPNMDALIFIGTATAYFTVW